MFERVLRLYAARHSLPHSQANLYSLVWRRAMASQMESAELQQVR